MRENGRYSRMYILFAVVEGYLSHFNARDIGDQISLTFFVTDVKF